MPRAGAPFQPVRFKGRAAFEKRARSREVATLYNGMFSTDRGLGETEQPFHSFDVNFFFLCFFPSRARGNKCVARNSIYERISYILCYFIIGFDIDIEI